MRLLYFKVCCRDIFRTYALSVLACRLTSPLFGSKMFVSTVSQNTLKLPLRQQWHIIASQAYTIDWFCFWGLHTFVCECTVGGDRRGWWSVRKSKPATTMQRLTLDWHVSLNVLPSVFSHTSATTKNSTQNQTHRVFKVWRCETENTEHRWSGKSVVNQQPDIH